MWSCGMCHPGRGRRHGGPLLEVRYIKVRGTVGTLGPDQPAPLPEPGHPLDLRAPTHGTLIVHVQAKAGAQPSRSASRSLRTPPWGTASFSSPTAGTPPASRPKHRSTSPSAGARPSGSTSLAPTTTTSDPPGSRTAPATSPPSVDRPKQPRCRCGHAVCPGARWRGHGGTAALAQLWEAGALDDRGCQEPPMALEAAPTGRIFSLSGHHGEDTSSPRRPASVPTSRAAP